MASSDIKGFYRQRKNAGVAKPSYKNRSSKAADGGDPAIVSKGDSFEIRDEHGDEEEELLRLFDMDMRYGPCLGLTRIERWDRAASMGLNPPPDAGDLLRRSTASLKPAAECLWEGRV